MRVVNLEQRSDDWLLWRESGLGSSDAAVLWFGKHFGKDVDTLLAEKRGLARKYKKKSAAMEKGIELEPKIRDIYEKWTGQKAEPLCALHDEHDWLKASLDGFLPQPAPGVVVEIKTVVSYFDLHVQALDNQVPDKYVPQLLHQCLVTDARMVHYVSYTDDESFDLVDRFALVPWYPHDHDLQRLMKLETEFWDAVRSQLPK
jgi:putative phage-type endonuclease